MKSLEFSIVSSSEAEDAWVDAKIDEFNRKELTFDGRQLETPMNYVAKEKNLVIAGIKSCFYLGEVVSIGVLFFDEKYRNKGLGGHLLSKVETEARIMGAKLAHLYAFDQTKDFYVKQGYEIFAVLENCPKAGHRCYYLKKNLMIYEKEIEKINSPIPREESVMTKVTLREVTKDTVQEICRLTPSDDQKQFVTPNATSIAEAHFQQDYAWFRAIYSDKTPVGFVMLGIDPKEDFCFLWRFMIDKKYQKLGFGRKALELVLEYLRSQTEICRVVTSYHQGQGDPSGFYKKLGFAEVDVQEDWGDLGREMMRLGEIRLELKFDKS